MCQNVKRRLVVRSNDDRRRSTKIFSENVAVTEISKQIIEVSSFSDREIWWKKQKNKNKNKTTTKTKKKQKNKNKTVKLFRDEYCFWEYAKKL